MNDEELIKITQDFFEESGGDPASLKKADAQSAYEPAPALEPVDIYQRNQDRLYEYKQKSFPNGASKIVSCAVQSVVDGAGAEGLARAYKRAEDDSEALKEKGERGRAQLVRQQYMQEYFLPALEIVINSSSPDELLNSKKALETLDDYTLLDGAGKGYTETYVRQAYGNELGQVQGHSDETIRSGVRRINSLLNEGQNRLALSVANGLKKQIEEGTAMADDADAELIGRVVAYFN